MALNETTRQLCTAALEDLLLRCDDVTAAMIAVRDGRPFAEKIRGRLEPGKFAAMASSLAALGQSVMRDLGAGMLDHVLIESVEGKLVIANVPGSGGLLILAVLARREARLGLVLGHTKTCALSAGAAIS
ncbi:MAG: hypothetical protein BGP24_10450 [Lysobacterales bacterium 69-70]|nr:roadblock/LC7 domain-containing protein [Xanthomonadaceae bacterium]ODU33354.1 MAG: hypothetical protein ABS97_13470 [Xanthomonadaceae bacterium SCN 69-320]ODV18027.1 MAG: hypothetical protein ABT27_15440 [Xanthomonadaceae bacterium SCN 69-25]OJZ00897.1 MAG: hypothetical protein BGP24_10450 [Xanthomonadales bacterium 69-70]